MRIFLCLLINVLLATCQDDKEKEDPCGQKEFYDPEGNITSPGFPENYPDDSSCFYRILTNRMISVKFGSFSLEQSDNCRYDYLQFVFRASAANATTQRYCGDGLDKVGGGELRGQGPLIVGFKSDESDSLSGFSFTFKFELNGPDPCLSDPCQNGANCLTYPGYYICNCPSGYAGINCEIDKDECLSYPCQNLGECVDGLNSFTCNCLNGYSGELCEKKPEMCSSDPCLNGGLCVERSVDFVCSCPRDFMGDFCEAPVPTPFPRTTTTTTPSTTPTPLTSASSANRTLSPGVQDEGGEAEQSEENFPATEMPTQSSQQTNVESNSSMVTAIAIVATCLVLLVAAGLIWYCWKRNATVSSKKMTFVKPTKEVTLISIKTRSERGKGKKGQRLARTTSFNSVTMKADANDKIFNQIHKVSEDVVMEEVTDDSGSSFIRPLPSTPVQNGNLPAIKVDGSLPYNSPHLKRLSIPITKNEPRVTGESTHNHQAVRRDPQIKPLRISPEDAVDLLNQMKQMQDVDHRSALEQYGFTSLPKGSFDQYNKSLEGNNYRLPNVPDPTKPRPNIPKRNKVMTSDVDTVELSPEEAAEVVNHFLQTDLAPRKSIGTREAMDIMQEVTNKRSKCDWPAINREKSVIVHPQEMANLVNNFHRPNQVDLGLSMDRNCESIVLASTYAPSEAGDRHHIRLNRDFREYSPIQEEDELDIGDKGLERNHENRQKRSSQDFGNAREEPELKRLRKKSKRFPYARTLDPDEKVHDWLKNTSKQKNKHGNATSPVEANHHANQTIITRPLAPSNQPKMNKKQSQNENTPRTIRNSRNVTRDNKNAITITENKAKHLVEKLVKAPEKSSQNVVGPGLGMSRENAFVDESF